MLVIIYKKLIGYLNWVYSIYSLYKLNALYFELNSVPDKSLDLVSKIEQLIFLYKKCFMMIE